MNTMIGIFISAVVSAFTAWVFWFPVRLFFFSLIPSTVEYAWVGKLLVMVIIAWFGGIALPLIVLVLGIVISVHLGMD